MALRKKRRCGVGYSIYQQGWDNDTACVMETGSQTTFELVKGRQCFVDVGTDSQPPMHSPLSLVEDLSKSRSVTKLGMKFSSPPTATSPRCATRGGFENNLLQGIIVVKKQRVTPD